MEPIQIYLLKGIGPLKFGQSLKEAEEIYGLPDEREELFDDFLNEKSHVLHYWALGFSLFFLDDEKKSFQCAEVDQKKAIIFDVAVFKLGEEEVKMLFKQYGFELTESELHTWGEKRLSFDEAFADLYFEQGKLVSINFCAKEEGKEDRFMMN